MTWPIEVVRRAVALLDEDALSEVRRTVLGPHQGPALTGEEKRNEAVRAAIL